jgi:3-oxoacyl-[acyl-carrier protein] reductase
LPFWGSSDTNKKDHTYFYVMENITGKRALITGGARGLGKAIAYALAKEGVHIAITGRNEAALKDTAAELAELGTEVTYAVFDVSNYSAVQQEIEQLKNTFGSFDILINNAGVASFSSVLDMDVADWTSIIHTNLLGTYFVTKTILPQLIEKIKAISLWYLRLPD